MSANKQASPFITTQIKTGSAAKQKPYQQISQDQLSPDLNKKPMTRNQQLEMTSHSSVYSTIKTEQRSNIKPNSLHRKASKDPKR